MFETVRGGVLMLVRWLIDYPILFGTYRIRNITRAPFAMQPSLQDHPGILVSNYGNYFFDDMIATMVAPVWPFVFARDSICRLFGVNPVLRFFRHVPVVRANDTKYTPEERKARNEKTFARAAELLKRGHWFSVFPETTPGHAARLRRPLRPGAAHIALKAEAESGWKLGLRIYVYGTNYENKFASRSYLYIRWASPIEVAKYRHAYQQSPAAAEQLLMNDIEQALGGVVLQAEQLEQLSAAYRLAFQRKQNSFAGVQQALGEVVSGRASPADLRQIVCRRNGESVTYQVVGYLVFFFGWVVSWPFRTFGRLCATEPSQEMTYQFVLWLLVIVTGTAADGSL
ncbi:MAG: 1-acyl-sn-glycerol-3-phosphate acyltransferase, partial [Deltaproteobacteria bacterium]|nr:1-acyl-sn-glycerol-3-phosphate acyltransferase [Deltaproteobacteria bacterium]